MMLALGSVRCRRGLLSVESSLKAALDGPSLHSGISKNSGPVVGISKIRIVVS